MSKFIHIPLVLWLMAFVFLHLIFNHSKLFTINNHSWSIVDSIKLECEDVKKHKKKRKQVENDVRKQIKKKIIQLKLNFED